MGLSDLVDVGRTDVIPGHTLTRPSLVENGLAEQQFVSTHLEQISRGYSALPRDERMELLERLADRARKREFRWGGETFDEWAQAPTMAPFLTFLLLRPKHPDITYEQVCELYRKAAADDGKDWAIRRATLELFGYDFSRKNAAGGTPEAGTPPTSTESSPSAASPLPADSGSAPATSAA